MVLIRRRCVGWTRTHGRGRPQLWQVYCIHWTLVSAPENSSCCQGSWLDGGLNHITEPCLSLGLSSLSALPFWDRVECRSATRQKTVRAETKGVTQIRLGVLMSINYGQAFDPDHDEGEHSPVHVKSLQSRCEGACVVFGTQDPG